MLRSTLPFFAMLCLVASTTQAQSSYRWVDDQGETHYGQTVPPEYKDYGYVRLGPDGTVLERVEPALDPEEVIERRRQRREQEQREAEQRNREARDRMLLATYSSEDKLRETLDMQLAGLQSQRASTRQALKLVENRFETLVGRAARLDRDGRAIPDSLQDSIDETREELRNLRADLDRLDQREQAARDRFAADLERYRELTAPAEDSG